ncbi:MAG: DUF433 domain-containing protein [Bryobacteraceae bacterium]
MGAQDWKDCPLVSIDPEVVHGEPVFKETRMPVEDAIENYYAYRDLQGMSDEEAVKATLESFPTIPGAEGLRQVLAYEAAREHQLQP